MGLADIVRDRWIRREGYRWNPEAWDEDVGYYVSIPVPTREDNDFIRFVTDNYQFKGDETVLDIGCGAGQYSVALSSMASEVVGIDFSGRMIDAARECAARNGAGNVRFLKKNWADITPDDPLLKDGFDVVFAHTTPAIGCARDFELMMDTAKQMCFHSMPVRRKDPLMESIWNMLGHDRSPSSGMAVEDDIVLYSFILGWDKGYNGRTLYETDIVWDEKRILKSVIEGCRASAARYGGFTHEEDAKVEQYLKSLADADGKVYSCTDTQIANILWDKRS